MIAVDTNLVVRVLTDDDPVQTAQARAVLAAGPIWIAKTVLLETAWVLRRVYGLDGPAVLMAFDRLIALESVSVEDEPAVFGALALMANGIDFADAFHLASRPAGTMFLSFDRSFVRRAERAGVDRIDGVPECGTA